MQDFPLGALQGICYLGRAATAGFNLATGWIKAPGRDWGKQTSRVKNSGHPRFCFPGYGAGARQRGHKENIVAERKGTSKENRLCLINSKLSYKSAKSTAPHLWESPAGLKLLAKMQKIKQTKFFSRPTARTKTFTSESETSVPRTNSNTAQLPPITDQNHLQGRIRTGTSTAGKVRKLLMRCFKQLISQAPGYPNTDETACCIPV